MLCKAPLLCQLFVSLMPSNTLLELKINLYSRKSSGKMQVSYPERSYIRVLDSINRKFFFIRLVLFYSPEGERIMNDKELSCWGIRFY